MRTHLSALCLSIALGCSGSGDTVTALGNDATVVDAQSEAAGDDSSVDPTVSDAEDATEPDPGDADAAPDAPPEEADADVVDTQDGPDGDALSRDVSDAVDDLDTSDPGDVSGDSDSTDPFDSESLDVADAGDTADVAEDVGGDADSDAPDGSDAEPTPEDCTNGVDDDGDGHADCGDPDCIGVVCRENTGVCDTPEHCSELVPGCPDDEVMDEGAPCRDAAGPCDRPEFCDGVAPTCPDDAVTGAGTVCRTDGGACDAIVEVCDGVGSTCPPDVDGCPDSTYCAGDECEPSKDIGDACDDAVECASGFCADGVCCTSACSGPCRSCATGSCRPHGEGTDPEDECGAYTCSGGLECHDDCDGSCGGGTPAHCKPAAGCVDGVCRADGGLGTAAEDPCECVSGRVANGVCCDRACAGVCEQCNASGEVGTCTVRPAGARRCPGFVCDGESPDCPESCDGDDDCRPNFACTDGDCVEQLEAGEVCDRARECETGICADGVCCLAECEGCGICRRGTGVCNPLPAGFPAADCGAYTCGTDGSCVESCDGDRGRCGNLACRSGFFCGSGDVCREARDLGGSCSEDCQCGPCLECDELRGECVPRARGFAEPACEPYACGVGGECASSCGGSPDHGCSSMDCARDAHCADGGVCQPQGVAGDECATACHCAPCFTCLAGFCRAVPPGTPSPACEPYNCGEGGECYRWCPYDEEDRSTFCDPESCAEDYRCGAGGECRSLFRRGDLCSRDCECRGSLYCSFFTGACEEDS